MTDPVPSMRSFEIFAPLWADDRGKAPLDKNYRPILNEKILWPKWGPIANLFVALDFDATSISFVDRAIPFTGKKVFDGFIQNQHPPHYQHWDNLLEAASYYARTVLYRQTIEAVESGRLPSNPFVNKNHCGTNYWAIWQSIEEPHSTLMDWFTDRFAKQRNYGPEEIRSPNAIRAAEREKRMLTSGAEVTLIESASELVRRPEALVLPFHRPDTVWQLIDRRTYTLAKKYA